MGLRDFLNKLEEIGELRRVKARVSVDLEIAEILRRVARGGPALLFENIDGFDGWRLVGNIFSKAERVKLALNCDPEEAGSKLVNMIRAPPLSLPDKVRMLSDVISLGRHLPKLSGADWKKGKWDRVDLERIPAIRTWPKDASRFFTFPIVITKDPETGVHHLGVYRMQLMDSKTTGMHWHVHKRGAAYMRKHSGKMPVAVAVGVDPALAFTAVAPVPEGIDSYVFAGIITGRSFEVSRGELTDLLIPSDAELVIEGEVSDEMRLEGPFGDHMGYYTPPSPFPVFRAGAIYTVEDPIFHATVVGYPWLEDSVIGKGIERLFLPLARMIIPELVDMNIPEYGLFHGLAIISIRKRYPGQARSAAMGLLGIGQFSLTKIVVVVDEDVNVHDINEVIYAIATTVDPRRDVQIIENAVTDELDHASSTPRLGSKMIIDATRKLREELGREWPERVEPDPEVARRVDERWREFGI
ncbi:UbiD family decarboxylase [Candidatus Korarchaeum cryptofilum]|jgi:4-hydroxy-3-polyprenylbenzoate decarboxylase|uniref:Anhydromevalonate phosphate decarboxylase n=1 Tax=Candidatus Korarchaeum cryptofilum TaxID=498846 RepID=A0A3R9QY63_9CREN|nr:UbiD family decarboxylase [Candidatus Korarchaeum cryptofilum]RSN68006.1 UbiD family decarboxylase [Candidatus Korarchaeum cryptofilum]